MKEIKLLNQYQILFDCFKKFTNSIDEKYLDKGTVLPNWTVRHIYCHITSVALSKLSSVYRSKKSHSPQLIPVDFDAVVKVINEKNAKWVELLQTLDFKVISEILFGTYKILLSEFRKLNPYEKAAHQVAWAHREISPNWLDIAREYTELWTHQMQIRESFLDYRLLEKDLYKPYLDVFFLAVDYHFRNFGDFTLKIVIDSKDPLVYFIRKINDKADVSVEPKECETEIIIPSNMAWKIWTRSITVKNGMQEVAIIGRKKPALHLLDMKCVMV